MSYRIELKGLLDIAQRMITKQDHDKAVHRIGRLKCRYFKTPNGLEWRMPINGSRGWGRKDPNPWSRFPANLTIRDFVKMVGDEKAIEYQPCKGDE